LNLITRGQPRYRSHHASNPTPGSWTCLRAVLL